MATVPQALRRRRNAAEADAPLVLQRPGIFVGRRAELARLAEVLAQVPVALICGFGGVGKSALAQAFADTWSGPVFAATVTGELDELIDDTCKQLGGDACAPRSPREHRMRMLAERVDDLGALWIVDDLHRLAGEERRALLCGLGAVLRRGRMLATSRERAGGAGCGPDHAELRLGDIDELAARELWHALDQLYGTSHGFEVALARYGGNPFLLRHAHAGALSDADPVVESVAALAPAARRVAGALALASIPLPMSLLVTLVDDGGRDQVRELGDRMIIDMHGDGAASMHDLIRDAVRQILSPSERAELHEELVRRLPDADLEPARRAREVCRQLRALGRHEEAARYLIERGGELDRYGVAGDLLRERDAVRAERKPSIADARFDLARAYAEHERLRAAGTGATAEMTTVRALLGLFTGHIGAARESAQEVLARPELSDSMRARAATVYGLILAFAGEPEAADDVLRSEAERFADTGRAASLWLYLAFVRSLAERGPEAEQALRCALVGHAGATLSYRSMILIPFVQASVAMAREQFDDAEASLREAEILLARGEDSLLASYLRYQRAALLHERGNGVAALDELRELTMLFERSGHLLARLSARALIGRILLAAGRRAEAARTLAEVRAVAEAHGYGGIIAIADRATALDPALRLITPTRAAQRPSSRAWSGLYAALRLAAAGERTAATALVSAALPAVERPGNELGRVLVSLVEALLAATSLDDLAAEHHLAAARAAAAAGGIDADLVDELACGLGTVRVITAAGARIVAEAGELPTGVVVDRRSDELRVLGQPISLVRRPMLRRLLHALLRYPPAVVSKDVLAEAMWSRPYNAVSDPGPLKSNVGNLRRLLEPGGVSIEFEEVGYRLTGDDQLACVETLPWADAARRVDHGTTR